MKAIRTKRAILEGLQTLRAGLQEETEARALQSALRDAAARFPQAERSLAFTIEAAADAAREARIARRERAFLATGLYPFKVRTSCGHIVTRKMREATAGQPYTAAAILEAPNGRPCDACEMALAFPGGV